MVESDWADFDPLHPVEDEDGETLAKIAEGIRDAAEGRTVAIEQVRRLVPQWITESSSRKER